MRLSIMQIESRLSDEGSIAQSTKPSDQNKAHEAKAVSISTCVCLNGTVFQSVDATLVTCGRPFSPAASRKKVTIKEENKTCSAMLMTRVAEKNMAVRIPTRHCSTSAVAKRLEEFKLYLCQDLA